MDKEKIVKIERVITVEATEGDGKEMPMRLPSVKLIVCEYRVYLPTF